MMERATATNKQEEDAPLLYTMVVASLPSLDDSTLRDIYSERKQRLLPVVR
jgi:hypothetical protein